jgi:hypothetical protein
LKSLATGFEIFRVFEVQNLNVTMSLVALRPDILVGNSMPATAALLAHRTDRRSGYY